MGVFARWVVGFGVCVWVVFVWVFALSGCWRACLGWWGSVVPPPPLPRLACLLACVLTLWCGRCWRVRGTALPDGRRAAMLGRDMVVPPHTAWRAVPGCCVRGEGEKGWGCSQGANARIHKQRDGVSWGGPCWLGWGWGWCWHTMLASSAHPRGSKIDTTGAGAGCAPGRGVVLVVGAAPGGGAPSFGCAWWCWGVGRFTLGGGDKRPKPRESKIDTTGAGARRPSRGLSGGCARRWLRSLAVAILGGSASPFGRVGALGSGGGGCAWWWRSLVAAILGGGASSFGRAGALGGGGARWLRSFVVAGLVGW